MSKSTQNGGVYLICNLRRCEFYLIILSSRCFSVNGLNPGVACNSVV